MKNQPLTSQLWLAPYIKLFLVTAAVFILSACSNMETQGRYQPLQESAFFPDGRSARPPAPGSLPFGIPEENDVYFTGLTEDGMFVETMPVEISLEVLERGRERYDIFCAPCHAQHGKGNGTVASRFTVAVPTFHDAARYALNLGDVYRTITHGKPLPELLAAGAAPNMPGYAAQIPVADRWAIALYVRALQHTTHPGALPEGGAAEPAPEAEPGPADPTDPTAPTKPQVNPAGGE